MTIPVKTTAAGYDIVLAADALNSVRDELDLERRVLVVTDSGVPSHYAYKVCAQCKAPLLITVKQGEESKSFETLQTLRIKESDRAQAMADELKKFGVSAVVEDNSVEIFPDELHKPYATLNGHNDHRIVMAMTVLSSMVGGEIEGVEAVRKSYPDFFEVLRGVGLEMENGIK